MQPAGDPDAAYLWFAAFKELDDIGHPDAWTALVNGCLARRRTLDFNSEEDTILVDALIDTYDEDLMADGNGLSVTHGAQPVFIVGMPRSGTTLLERLLAGHPDVVACGELQDLPAQLRWACDRRAKYTPDASIARAARAVDGDLLGRRYLERTQWRAGAHPRYTDKLPRNVWNIGAIARALPGASFLHMVRNPMDTCFSNLKELFGDAYPHSYNLRELARHYAEYRRLIAHWHAVLPGRILDVRYEHLVQEPVRLMRRVLALCALDWNRAVIDQDQSETVVTTASTVQVRAPIHQRSVGGWRRYATHLEPLRMELDALGALSQPG
jgi:hypothetical protein